MFKFGAPPPLDWHECLIPKKSGGVRVLEIPCKELRKEQRRILQYLYYERSQGRLQVSNVSHGFIPFRSIDTDVLSHPLETKAIACMDMHDFFPMCPTDPAFDQMKLGGIPNAAIDYFKTCCMWDGRYGRLHFPQGSPTSPFLTNLTMFECDCMIASYAKKNGLKYTRYADDIQLSAIPGTEGTARFKELTKSKEHPFLEIFYGVETILKSHLGLELNHKKDHVIKRWTLCKPQILGTILRQDNLGYNAPRKTRRRVRAALCNLYHKVKNNHGVATLDDLHQWASIKGSIDNMDRIRSTSPCWEVAGSDPTIQTKFLNYLYEVIDGEIIQPVVCDC